MSTAHGPARSRPVRRPANPRQLSAVPRLAPTQQPRTPFVVLVVALMAVGLVGLLVINTSMQRKAFELTNLQQRADTLQERRQALEMDVERLSSPDRIAEEADRLGMVPVASPAFVRLEDGEVLGQPRAAMPGTNLPGLSTPVTAADPNAEPGSSTGDEQDGDSGSGHDQNGDDRNADEQNGGSGTGHDQNGDEQNADADTDTDADGRPGDRDDENAGDDRTAGRDDEHTEHGGERR